MASRSEESQVTSDALVDSIVVKINGLVHLVIVRQAFVGLVSYQMARGWYAIRFVFDNGAHLVAQYDNRGTWEQVLGAIDGAF